VQVAKAGPKVGKGSKKTRRRLVEAAIETLKEEGFAGASARAIGRRGDLNPALIFYHFGSVNDLLLAALDETSRQRMERYQEAVRNVEDLSTLIGVAADIYREDLESGHITVLAEMIAGASSVPDLGPEIASRMEPWVEFAEAAIGRVLRDTPMGQVLPVRDIAFAVVALYLGVELVTHLDDDARRAESLFAVAGMAGSLLAPLLGAKPR
jgi:AcrR family transcriptional regulator